MKKILTALLAVFMVVPTVCAASFTDVSTTDNYYEAVSVLEALDLVKGYTDTTFGPDQTITRAEAAAIVVRMLGMESAASQGATKFTDVTADHWASGYINVGVSQGIIAGHGDGTFKPEDPVTYEQMVKMIVYAMGFEPMAKENGIYPANVMAIAAQYDVLDKVSAVIEKPAPRKDVALMVYNAIDKPLMMVDTFGGKYGSSYSVFNDTSILDHYLDIKKFEGIVISNDYGSDVTRKKVRVYNRKDKETYDAYIGKTNAADYLGQDVVIYAKELREGYDDYEIVAIIGKASRNTMTTITDMDLIESYEDGVLEYYKDVDAARTTRIKIDKDATFIYNGDSDVPAEIEDTLKIKEGSISFLDNDNDNLVDFVFIDEFEDLVVDSVTNAGRILGKDGFGALTPADDDEVTYYIDGEEVGIDKIEEGDVLSIYANNRKTAYKVVINKNNVVTGTISSVNKNTNEYRIDGEWYKLCPCYQQAVPQLQDEGTWYLNANGNIVYKDDVIAGAAKYYAVIMNIAETDNYFDEGLTARYMDSKGKVVTCDFAKNATYKVDGVSKRISEESIGTVEAALIHQVARIRTNSNDDIASVEVIESVDGVHTYTFDKYEKFFNQYPLAENAVIFNTDSESGSIGLDEIEVLSVNSLSDDEDYQTAIYLNSEGEIAVVVMVEGTATVASDAGLYLIIDVGVELDEEGEEVIGIEGYTVATGSKSNYYIVDDAKVTLVTGIENGVFTTELADATDIGAGALVNFSNTGKMITAINVIYDPSNPDAYDYSEYTKAKLVNKETANSFIFGEVYEKRSGNLMIGTPNDEATELTRIPTTGAKYIAYDYNRNRVFLDVALNDITPYYNEDNPGTVIFVTLDENDRTKEIILIDNFDY